MKIITYIIIAFPLLSGICSAEEITINDAYEMAGISSPGATLAKANHLQGEASLWDGIGAVTPTLSVNYTKGKYHDRDSTIIGGQTLPVATPDTSHSLQVQANYTLLTGISPFNFRGFLGGIASYRSANAGFKEDMSQLHIDVAQSFYNVLKTQKLVEVAKTTLEASTYNENLAESKLRTNAISRSEYLKISVQEGNDKINLIGANSAYEIARNSFFTSVGRHNDREASFVFDETEFEVNEVPELEDALDAAYNVRPKLDKDLNDYRAAKNSYYAALDNRWPSLGAFATYSWNDYDYMWSDSVNIDANDSWFVGLNVSWYPLNAFTSESSIRRAKAAKIVAESNYELSKQSLEIEVTNAYYEYKKQAETIIVARGTFEAAEEDFSIVNRLYEMGGASAIELSDANALYTTAATNYYNALYDYQIADLNWLKAIGELQKQF